MKITLLTLLLLTLSILSFAQSKILTGTVTDQSMAVLTKASIQVYRNAENKPYSSTVTDGNGKFSISVMSNDIIRVNHVGYLSFSFVFNGKESTTIRLKYDENKLNQITIKGAKPLVEFQFDRTVVNVDGEGKSGMNALEVIRKIPSLTVLNGNDIRLREKVLLFILMISQHV